MTDTYLWIFCSPHSDINSKIKGGRLGAGMALHSHVKVWPESQEGRSVLLWAKAIVLLGGRDSPLKYTKFSFTWF